MWERSIDDRGDRHSLLASLLVSLANFLTQKGEAEMGSVIADSWKVFRLLVLGLVAWLVPERLWYSLCRLFARISPGVVSGRGTSQMPAYLAHLAGVGSRRAAIDCRANLHRDTVEVLRCHRPGGWSPKIDLVGEEYLVAAIRDGHGAIIWVADFASASLVAKMALARRGYEVGHLSRPDHGFSRTPFGVRFLNPVRRSIEDRYLEKRVMMIPDERSLALRRLRRRLSEGKLISVTVGRDGTQTVTVGFFNTVLELPTGPVTLSRATLAPLLPLFW